MSTILAQDQITLYSFSDGANGKNAITAALTNDSHVIPCDKSGLSGNYTGANSSLIIYEGATDVTSNWTVKVTASSGITGSLSGKTYTVTGITVDSGYVDFVATRSGYSQITKRFNITRTKVGATGGTGAASTTYWMVTSASIISKSQASVLTPSSITFSAKSQTGTANPVNYSGRYAIFINGSTTAAYTSSANETSKVYTIPSGATSIRCVLYQAGGTTTVLDEQTIPVVSDGKNGTNGTNGKTYVLNILNGTRGVTYNTSGTNPVPAMSAFSCELYENGTKVTPASYSWSVPSSASLLSGSSTAATFAPTIASAFDGAKGNNAIFLTVTYAGQTVKQSVVISATKIGDKGDKGNSGSNGKTYVLSITGGKTTILYNASGASPTPSSLGTFSCELYENGTKVTSGITYTWSVPSTNSVLSKPSATTAATFSPGLLTSGFNTNTHYDNTITLTVAYAGQTVRATQPIAVSRTGDTGGKGDKGEQGKAGTDSINVVCSNESELYPSNTSGNVTPAKSVTTKFTAYQGTTIVPCTVKLPTAPSGMTISQTTANNIVTVTLTVSNNATLGNSATLSGTLDFEVTAGGRTFVKTFSWSKVKTGNTGATGAAAKAVDITASSQVFKSTDGGITFSPNTITLTPTYQGGLAFSKWQYSQDGGATWKDVASGSNGLTVSNGILTVNKTCNLFTTTITSLSFKIITNNASYFDVISIIKLYDVTDIKISTRNLLRNTSYEKDIVGTNNRGTYHVLSRDTATSYNNNYSLKVVCNTKSVSGTNDVWQLLWDALIPNENLMLSFYVKGSVATTAWIRVVPASSNAMPTFNITTDWKRVIIDLGKVSAAGTRGSTELIYGFNATGTFYINSMMLHYGNTPTAWTPAPEDTEELITTVTTTLAAVKLTVDEDHKSIVGKVWQSDITNKINSYDSTTSKALRDRVSKTETDITGIKNTVSDVQTTISKKADGTTVTELTNRLAKAEQDANGFKQTVKNTYATQTNLDKTNNKVTNLQQTGLGWKVNYSAFATADNGEIYLHGYEGVEGKAADVDGWVLWNGAKVTIPKGKIDPNAICPYAAPIYIVRRTSNNTTYLVWYNSGWKWSVSQPTAVGGTWTWVTATDIVLGAFVEPSSEAAIVGAQLFTPPKTADEIKISSEVSSSIVQKANEITNTVSKTYQTKADASQISQKVDSITNKVTTAQGDITKLQQTAKEITSTVTNTNKRIDDISVGSVNIATGTNNGNVGWTWSMQAGTYTGESITEDEINCCKLTRNDDAQTGWSVIQYSSIGRNKYLANTEYIISIEIKPSVDTSFSANLIEPNGTNSLLAVVGFSSNVAKDTWNKVAWHIKTKETLPDSLAQVLYLTGMSSAVGVSYMFRNLKIEKGNLTDPTDWTPAPEDIDSEFSKVSQDITGITSTVKDIGDNVSKVQQTAEELNVNFSTLSDDLSGLSNKVGETNEKIERNYSNINASIDSITSEINSVKEDVIQNSEILQTADGWKALFAQLGMYDVPDVITNVLMSIHGIEVSNPLNGTKTMMTTEKFAGYYNDGTMDGNGVMTFGLEKDQVITEKLVANKGCDFITSKLVPITYDNSNVKHPALVFVKSNT